MTKKIEINIDTLGVFKIDKNNYQSIINKIVDDTFNICDKHCLGINIELPKNNKFTQTITLSGNGNKYNIWIGINVEGILWESNRNGTKKEIKEQLNALLTKYCNDNF